MWSPNMALEDEDKVMGWAPNANIPALFTKDVSDG